MEPLADNLRRLRKAAGLTQAQLAERAGLSRATCASMEQAEANPGIEAVVAVAAALSVGVEELVATPAGERWFLVPPKEHRPYRADQDRFEAVLVSPIASRGVEIQHLHLAPGCKSVGRPHPRGAQEFFYTLAGTATLVVDDEAVDVPPRHLLQFPGHQQHVYRNLSASTAVEAVSAVVLAVG